MGASNSKPSNEDPKDAVKEKLKSHKEQQQQEVGNAQRTQHLEEKQFLNEVTREAQLEGKGANPLNVASDAENKEMAKKLKQTNEESKAKPEPFEIGDDAAEEQRKKKEKDEKMEEDVTATLIGGRRRRKRTRRRKKKSKKKKKKSKKRRKRKRKRTKKKRRRRKSRK